MSRRIAAAAMVAAVLSTTAFAQDMSGSAVPGAPAAAQMSEGEVRKIDKDAQKITIKHGPISNLDMPPMTMVFRVKDPAMLDQVSRGDQVSFSAEKIDGAYTITRISKSK